MPWSSGFEDGQSSPHGTRRLWGGPRSFVPFAEPTDHGMLNWTGAAEQDAWVDPVFVAMDQLCKVAGIPNERLWPD